MGHCGVRDKLETFFDTRIHFYKKYTKFSSGKFQGKKSVDKYLTLLAISFKKNNTKNKKTKKKHKQVAKINVRTSFKKDLMRALFDI